MLTWLERCVVLFYFILFSFPLRLPLLHSNSIFIIIIIVNYFYEFLFDINVARLGTKTIKFSSIKRIFLSLLNAYTHTCIPAHIVWVSHEFHFQAVQMIFIDRFSYFLYLIYSRYHCMSFITDIIVSDGILYRIYNYFTLPFAGTSATFSLSLFLHLSYRLQSNWCI